MRERFLFWASLVVLVFSLLVGFSTARLVSDHEERLRRQEDLMRQQVDINANTIYILDRLTKESSR